MPGSWTAEEVRAKFPQVNKLILMTKKVFLISSHRMRFCKQHLSGAPLPLEPVPTRWGTWIEAVNFYSENFETVKSIVAKFHLSLLFQCVNTRVHSAIHKWPIQLTTYEAILGGFRRV
jgi:hypothetical protein